MKKVLIGLTALTMATSVMAAGRTVVETRVGGSFAGAYKTESDSAWDKKTSGIGYEVAVEGMQEVSDNFFLGLGVAYQNHAKSKNALTDTKIEKAQIFKSVPVYLTAKYQFDLGLEFVPFVKANLGYSFNLKGDKLMGEKQKMENGLYYAVGAGVDYNNFVMDLSYQVNQGKVDSVIGKLKADHSRVTLGLGYRFDL
jgi:opacity protein-like surface antigen